MAALFAATFGSAAAIRLTLDVPGLRTVGFCSVGRMRLPTESIGSAIVTFAGVQAGSEIRVYLPDSTEIAGIESCAADQTLAWPAYVAGSPNNTVRIVILSNTYRLKEFTYTSSVGAQNLPVQQEPDKWYSNPA